MTIKGAPKGRTLASSIWTGSEMIVWGGADDPTWPTNTGGRYDPIADEWRHGTGRFGQDIVAAKAGAGGATYDARVTILRLDGMASVVTVDPFPTWPGFGAKVAGGNVDGAGYDEILAAPGPGPSLPPQVRGFARDGLPVPGLDFMAYGAGGFGANVGSGRIEGQVEILTGPGPSPAYGPQVRAFRFSSGTVTPNAKVSFYAYGTLRYGVGVASGDVDGDGYDEILTGAGLGAVFGPHVRGFNYDGVVLAPLAKVNFLAYGTPRQGVLVSCGQIDRDPFDEILTGPGPSAAFASQLRGFNVDGGSVVAIAKVNTVVFPGARDGLNVGSSDVEDDGLDEIVCGPGPDPGFASNLEVFDFDGVSLSPIPALSIDPFGVSYGLRVAGASVGF